MPLTSFEGVVDPDGTIRLEDAVSLPPGARVVVTVMAGGASPAARAAGHARRWEELFEPVRQLGRGGMGATYLARDRLSSSLVCVKHLLSNVDPRALQQECRALARLDHPCIVRLLNFDTASAEPYLVVEYVDGPTLAAYSRDRALREPVALQIAEGVFNALAYAHGRDVLHRDLKPGNVLLTHDGLALVPKVLDFGLAVVDRRDRNEVVTAFGMLEGTPAYMAPEQISGATLTPACDVYAAGQILWELLSGRVAFAGPVPTIVREKFARRGGLTLARGTVTDGVAALVEQATRRSPEERPTAADALARIRTLLELAPPAVVAPVNLAFERCEPDESPSGWFNGAELVGGVSTAYVGRVVVPGPGRPRHVALSGTGAGDDQFGTLMQRFPATGLAGCDLRFAARLATDGVSGSAGLWVRVDGVQGTLAFDNMPNGRLSGTCGWRAVELVLRVPPRAAWINYGVLLVGRGTVRVQSPELLARGEDRAWRSLAIWQDEGTAHTDDPELPLT